MFADDFLTEAQIRALLLERVNVGYLATLETQLREAASQIRRDLLSLPDFKSMRRRELEIAIEEILASYEIATPDLISIAEEENAWVFALLGLLAARYALGNVRRGPTTFRESEILIRGATAKEWFNKAQNDFKFVVRREINQSLVDDRNNTDVVNSLVSQNRQLGDDAFSKMQRDLESVTKTGIFAASNVGRVKNLVANRNIIAGLEHQSILDNRTSLVCLSRDGSIWDTEGNHISGPENDFRIPPLHFNCRSTLIPVRFVDGEIESTSGARGEQWIVNQPREVIDNIVGKQRFDLFLNNKITFQQMISKKSLRPLSLEQLRSFTG